MPPKSKRPKTTTPRYLFVNQDASTLLSNTRDPEFDRTKQSHVQRHKSAPRKLSESQRSPSKSISSLQSPDPTKQNPPPSEQEHPRAPIQEGNLAQYLVDEDKFADFLNRSLLSLDYTDESLFEDIYQSISPNQTAIPSHEAFTTFRQLRSRPSFEADSRLSSTSVPLPTVLTNPSEDEINPFADTRVALEQWGPPLIQYHTTVIVPSMFRVDARATPLHTMRHAPAVHADMRACMSAPAHMYALLASASARMLSEEGRLNLPNVTEKNYVRVPLFFKTKASEALRVKLARGHLDPSVVVDVSRLMTTSVFLDDLIAAETHLQALRQMIDSLGGLDTFDDYTKESLVLLDILAAMKSLGVPNFEPTWDPGKLPEKAQTRVSSVVGWPRDLIGTHLKARGTAELFNQDITAIIYDLIELVDLAFLPTAQANLLPHDLSWITLRTAAIDYRLLSFAQDETLQGDFKQLSTVIALLLWTGLTLGDTARKRSAARQVRILKAVLENSDLISSWHPHSELLLWVATLGALCADRDDEISWFGQVVLNAAQRLGLTELADLENCLRGFLYVENLQAPAVASLVQRLDLSAVEFAAPDTAEPGRPTRDAKGKAREVR